MPTPDLPQTEDEARGKIIELRAVFLSTQRFLREYDDAVTVLKQDAVTAYATAVRAAERRARVSHS